MRVVNDYRGHYSDSIERHYRYDLYETESDTDIFLNGQGCIENANLYAEKFHSFTNRVTFNYEQPCAFQDAHSTATVINNSADVMGNFHKIYTICPYSAEWLNNIQGQKRFYPTWVPYPKEKIFERKEDKCFDTLYWGGIHHQNHVDFLTAGDKFNSNFLTLGYDHWPLKRPECKKYITGQNLPRESMWETIRKTKITLGTNLLYLTDDQVSAIKRLPSWSENECFSKLDLKVVPQMKTRPVEAAINRSLILIKKDPWNVIEKWYTPGEDFIYYENKKDLQEKIREISTKWENYEHIVESAYNKTFENYTTEHFFNMIRGG